MKYDVIVSRKADEMLVSHARFLAQVSIPAAKVLRHEFPSNSNWKRILDYLAENTDGLFSPKGTRLSFPFLKTACLLMPSLIANNHSDHTMQESLTEIRMDGIERCADNFHFGGIWLIFYGSA